MYRRTSYFATLSLAALLITMAGCGSDNPTGPTPYVAAPTVSSTNPGNGGTGVAVITASFSRAMDASTITTATFTVSRAGGIPVAGTVAYDPLTKIATFTPTSHLPTSTRYAALVSTAVRDAAGNALASNHAWQFTTSG